MTEEYRYPQGVLKMKGQDIPRHLIRALAPPRLATGTLLALALLSGACGDQPSSITSTQHLSSSAALINSPLLSEAAAPNFAVLADAAVTCTDSSITGNVGTFRTAAPGAITLTQGCTIAGKQHIGDPAAKAAFASYVTAYGNLAPKTGDCTVSNTLTALDNGGVPLQPGVYCFVGAATSAGGVLTLNGPSTGLWTFKVGTGGTGALTGTDFTVFMTGGGQACNVTWWVAQGATMTRGFFRGNILAGAAIGFTGPGTFDGNAWAGASGVGDVTFGYTTVTGCATSNGKDKDHRGHHGKGHGDHDHRGDQGHGK
jgi:hypothetical protein